MKRLVTFIVLLILAINGIMALLSVPAAAGNECSLYLKVESFTWTENSESGTKLLEETGPLYALGSSARWDINKLVTLGIRAEQFVGTVDYDGQTQDGEPVETDTGYLGFLLEGDMGYKFAVREKGCFELFAGPGYKWWERNLKSTGDAIGYIENWWSFYTRWGIRGRHTLSERLTAFAEAGVKIPLASENEVDLGAFGFPNVTLEPGNKSSIFAEAGIAGNRLRLSLFYDGMRFSQSDLDDTYNRFYQPESKADIFGLSIGAMF